ncbi:exosortase-associated protein EpsI, B-type [Aromatoleum diolicum]|uniref:EpsI family protein n=1 Tax=Aromatoleum diolicum TaxID=75796 RepID=A0ABX1QHU3_9RHOO|nr:exosortase-associated protein EpsI, B-type [Aromatoleum diolicum]NMG76660.1 EpsI family protein [Aromatoleum diolicum]
MAIVVSGLAGSVPYYSLKCSLLLCALMISSFFAAIELKPVKSFPESQPPVDYENIIPRSFSAWNEVESGVVEVVNPQQQQELDAIYSQVVTRLYRHTSNGEMVMLSIAYGDTQSKQSQVHRPELCYPAQGFQISSVSRHDMYISGSNLPVMRLIATLGPRREPVTYWIRLGDQIVNGGLEQKITTIKEGLAGHVADGLLFRVSSISADTARAFQAQELFVDDLLRSIPDHSAHLLIGRVREKS